MKAIKIMILIVSIISVSGCYKLKEEVFSEVLAKDFNPSEKDIPSLIGAVYATMRPTMTDWGGYLETQEETGDAIIYPHRPNGWGGPYLRYHRHTWTPEDSHPSSLWGSSYKGVNTANRLIYQIESGQIPMTVGKEKLLAELRAVRAFFYFILMDNFGNVPLVTNFVSQEVPLQSKQIDIYNFVVKELQESIPLLAEEVSKTTYGRFTKWAAKTLLAKIYLNAKFYTGTVELKKCLSLCDEVIASGKYILEPNYKESFKTYNENSRELIFAVPYDEVQAPGFFIHMMSLDPQQRLVFKMESGPWGGSCAVPQFINTYDPEDGRLKDTWLIGNQINPDNGNIEVSYPNFVKSIDEAGRFEGYRIQKYEIKLGVKTNLSNDFPVFRYAEVMMMKAECLLRIGDADAAAAIVTTIRQRDFKTNLAKATVTGTQLKQGSSYVYGYSTENGTISPVVGGADVQYGRFLDELGWEFAIEAHRRQDLIRFDVFTMKTWFNHTPNGDYRKLWPIPQKELNKNPNLKQNPGY